VTDLATYMNAHPLPLSKLLGIEILEASKDGVTARLIVREEICTAGQVLHGGVYMALADTAGAIAAQLNLPEGARTTTVESKTNFLGAAAVGTEVMATATPVHVGRRTSVWQTRLTSPEGKLLALVTQTQMAL
jgi:1,4-dihydroxy-2-naphthoyl-CoA hydrolase